MKKIILIITLFGCIIHIAFGQDLIQNTIEGILPESSNEPPNKVAELIAERKQQRAIFQPVNLFALSAEQRRDFLPESAIPLVLSQRQLDLFLDAPSKNLNFNIPVSAGKILTLELTQVQITSNGFTVTTASGKNTLSEPSGVFYRGIVKGDNQSMVTLSVFSGRLKALILHHTGNFSLQALSDQQDNYVLVNEKYLPAKADNWTCYTSDITDKREQISAVQHDLNSNRDEERCVKVYVETEFQVYKDNSRNIIKVVDYVLGIFGDVIAIYADIDVNMEVSQIFIWDKTDPYNVPTGNTVDSTLNLFISNRPTFNGNIAHLITTRGGIGGLAADIGSICTSKSYCVSGGLEDTSTDPKKIPKTSNTLVRVAHEMGHLLGSPHTHACKWGPSKNIQIDDCGNVWAITNMEDDDDDKMIDEMDEAEGNKCFNNSNRILPSKGQGTIMSYCHLIDTIGRNLLNGFGTEPANIIRKKVMESACLVQKCSCDEFTNRTVNGAPIPSAVYTASNSITSSGDANGSMSIVIFQAGNRIELTPGFEGTELFVAQIVDGLCTTAGGTFAPVENGESKELPSAVRQGQSQLNIYPNPANDFVQLAYNLASQQKITIALYNQYGQLIQMLDPGSVQFAGQHNMQVVLSRFSSGLYYAVLQSSTERLVKSFVVSRL